MTELIIGLDYSPWIKPIGKIATFARYQAFTGIKYAGPHRTLADKLLENVTCKCETCQGTGLYGTYGGLGWRACPNCHGMGETYAILLDELMAKRKQVLDLYPEAAAPNWKPGYPIKCPILKMDTNLIIDACPEGMEEPVQLELAI